MYNYFFSKIYYIYLIILNVFISIFIFMFIIIYVFMNYLNYSNSSRTYSCSSRLLNKSNIVFELDSFIKRLSFLRIRMQI